MDGFIHHCQRFGRPVQKLLRAPGALPFWRQIRSGVARRTAQRFDVYPGSTTREATLLRKWGKWMPRYYSRLRCSLGRGRSGVIENRIGDREQYVPALETGRFGTKEIVGMGALISLRNSLVCGSLSNSDEAASGRRRETARKN